MEKITYYDRPFYLGVVVDLSNIKSEDERKTITAQIEERYKAFGIGYPSDYVHEQAALLGSKGYPVFKGQFPYRLNSSEIVALFHACISRFNGVAKLHNMPNTLTVKKDVARASDLVEIIDALTMQQDALGIGQIWKLANAPSKVAYSNRNTPLNERVARFAITLSKKGKLEEKMVALFEAIDTHLESARLIQAANAAEAKYR